MEGHNTVFRRESGIVRKGGPFQIPHKFSLQERNLNTETWDSIARTESQKFPSF
jgi:hypothetical protein